MAYFPHAFQKLMLATNAAPFLDGNNTNGTNGTNATTSLLPGQIGFVSAKNHKVVDLDPANVSLTYANFPLLYLAQGSFHPADKDKIGPFHGGYTETVKSKGINPKYVSGFYYAAPKAPVQNIIIVKPGANCVSLTCDTTYRLRVDVKGSPALRFLTHNAYLTVDAYTGCCNTDNGNGVDPLVVLLQWKEALAKSPIMAQFVSPKVWNVAASTTTSAAATSATSVVVSSATGIAAGQKIVGIGIPNNTFVGTPSGTTIPLVDAAGAAVTVTVASGATIKTYTEVTTAFDSYTPDASASSSDAFIELTAAYADTTFGNASFQPTDFYEVQPLQLVAAVVDDMDQPCATKCFGAISATNNSTVTATMSTVFVTNSTTGGVFETQATAQGNGFGETIIRELILSNRYQQEPWNNDPRLREVLDDTTFASGVTRSSRYGAYYILHSVPRKSNPSGTMDADQYLVKIVVTGANTTFSNFVNAWLAAAGSEVSLQTV